MKSGDMTSLIKLFNKQNVQYFAGITQRNFEWTKTELETYWDCLENNANLKTETPHFMNCIITKPVSSKGLLDYISLTDGQQRMTTTVLNICAICAFAKHNDISKSEFDYEGIRDQLLINPIQNGDDRYKLLLREKDRETLKLIIDELPFHLNNGVNRSPKLINAYNYMYNKLNLGNYQEIFNKMTLMTTLEIIADPTDDENIIFESINTAGRKVSLFDQARAFTLSRYDLDTQEKINRKCWQDIENSKYSSAIIKGFITYNTEVIPHRGGYPLFKKLVLRKSPEEISSEIHKYYETFSLLINRNTDNEYLNSLLEGISLIISPEAYVSFVKIYNFYLNNEINIETLVKCFELILSVFMRLKLKMKNIDSTVKHIFGGNIKWIEPNNIYAKIYKKLSPYFVSDTQFEMVVKSKNFYFGKKKEFGEENSAIPSNINKITNYLLLSIENHHYPKGRINPNEYSTEHICPQTLGNGWEHFFNEEDHHDYVHSLGNLTLTAYNSEYSNLSFKEKKMMENGFKEDKLYLNQCICSYHSWTVDSIQQRTAILAEELCEIFSIPANNLPVTGKGNQSILVGGK